MQNLKFPDYIGSRIYVTVTHARMLVGTLVATDSELNLLLDDVEEITGDSCRKLGLISVPQATIQSIKVETAQLENLEKSKQLWSHEIV
ncbi:LANO_0G15962g1_1 [Lachancea nothofagi CBS 11611]|uniref:LANO_0G15962g1_1 n=1 Tax=Lachancea nothofagi CBS 11611 TaxID=1266666 RepID=A0A1G4KKH7_9SACH|nr:LANO_0G15962g1_1 [Lachancea nothofagi CBS 11611]